MMIKALITQRMRKFLQNNKHKFRKEENFKDKSKGKNSKSKDVLNMVNMEFHDQMSTKEQDDREK